MNFAEDINEACDKNSVVLLRRYLCTALKFEGLTMCSFIC